MEAGTISIFKRGPFLEQLEYIDDCSWTERSCILRGFAFPLLDIVVSVQASKEHQSTFCLDGQYLTYPALRFDHRLEGRTELEARDILPLTQAVDFEVGCQCVVCGRIRSYAS